MNKQQQEAFQKVIQKHLRFLYEQYMEIVDVRKPWTGKPGKAWDIWWEHLVKAMIEDTWIREKGNLTGCVFGKDKHCPTSAPALCGGCADNSQTTEKWWTEVYTI